VLGHGAVAAAEPAAAAAVANDHPAVVAGTRGRRDRPCSTGMVMDSSATDLDIVPPVVKFNADAGLATPSIAPAIRQLCARQHDGTRPCGVVLRFAPGATAPGVSHAAAFALERA
jgi:hypothetical protein